MQLLLLSSNDSPSDKDLLDILTAVIARKAQVELKTLTMSHFHSSVHGSCAGEPLYSLIWKNWMGTATNCTCHNVSCEKGSISVTLWNQQSHNDAYFNTVIVQMNGGEKSGFELLSQFHFLVFNSVTSVICKNATLLPLDMVGHIQTALFGPPTPPLCNNVVDLNFLYSVPIMMVHPTISRKQLSILVSDFRSVVFKHVKALRRKRPFLWYSSSPILL